MRFDKNAGHLPRMPYKTLHSVINIFLSLIWLANGLLCKVLNLVPRHQMIVARILGDEYARPITLLIGVSEILMAVWIISGIQRRWNAVCQMLVIAIMNAIEFFLAPDLLLWGKANAFFALLLIALIYGNEFVVNKKRTF